jgi:hypothetical protein
VAERDPNWHVVAQFVSDLRNASRLAAYVDTVVDIYETGAWRRYTDATGRSDEWRQCEFDYFLIACGAEYSDVQRLLAWDKARAVDLAAAMESDDATARRPLEDASAAWQSPTGLRLDELASNHGWTRTSGQLKVPPAPDRARARARTGLTKDEHARQVREARIAAPRREQLEHVATSVVGDVESELELRYVVDVLRDQLRRGIQDAQSRS